MRSDVVRPHTAKGARARRTIGVLVDWLKNGYQDLVFSGLVDAADAMDVNLLCFAGGIFASDVRHGATRNLIYDYVGPHLVDGLVLMSGTLVNVVGPAAFGRYCERYHPLPMTSIGVPLPGMPNVTVDDAEGMRAAVRHLIEQHGHKRIGFIRGPEASVEAEQRYQAYREVLAEKGLPFDESLVAPGDFQPEAGAAAVRLLLDRRRIKLDALVGANDHMALGALVELKERGVRIPQEIALVGFDDIDEARFSRPPLTTVRQPLYQQGEQALHLLLENLDAPAGSEPARPIAMTTEMIVRESCGCALGEATAKPAMPYAVLAPGDDPEPTEQSLDELLAKRRAEIVETLRRIESSTGGGANPGWEHQIIDAFAAGATGGIAARERFSAVLEKILAPIVAAGTDMAPWHHIVTALRRFTLPALMNDSRLWLRAEDLWHAARVQIAEAAERVQARQKLQAHVWARRLGETSEALLGNVDVPSLMKVVAGRMPHFGIESCFVSMYDAGQGPPTQARLVLGYRSGAPAGAPALEGVAFPPRNLVPGAAWPRDRRWTLIAEPLTFERRPFGMLLLEMGPREGIIYESLREQISSALNSAHLIDQVVQEAAQRQQAESDRRKSVQDLFDNMQQAIFTVGPDLRIGQEVSAYARQLFGDVPVSGAKVSHLLRLDAVPDREAVGRMIFWLECIFGCDELQWSLSAGEPLRSLDYRRPNPDGTFEPRALQLDYAPIYEGKTIARVMFIVKDVTEVLRLQAEVAQKDEQNRENLARIKEIAGVEPEHFATFLREARQILTECQTALRDIEHPDRRTDAIHRVFRGMHTLKGNARIFDLTAIQRIAHAAEETFQKVRDGEIPLPAERVATLAGKIDEVRGLVHEFERLGRQVLGLDRRDALDQRVATFLHGAEVMLERWRSDLLRLEEGDDPDRRGELRAAAERFRDEARSLGLPPLETAAGALARALAAAPRDTVRTLAAADRALAIGRSVRALADEIAGADLLPWFFDECERLQRRAFEPPATAVTPKASPATRMAAALERTRLTLTLVEASATSFGLPALASAIAHARDGGPDGPDTDDRIGGALLALGDWTACCRTLARSAPALPRPGGPVDVLARFQHDATAVLERMRVAAAAEGGAAALMEEARAVAERFHLRRATEAVEAAIERTSPDVRPAIALAGVAEGLGRQLAVYQLVRDELRGAPGGDRALREAPADETSDERTLRDWLEAAERAGLQRLVAECRTLSRRQALQLVGDVRRFEGASAGLPGHAAAGPAVVRVPEARIGELRRVLKQMQGQSSGARGDGRASVSGLADLEGAVRHLTTPSLADLLAPLAQRAGELARERGKLLRPVTLDGLGLFLEAAVMQKVRDAVGHAVVNAIDHALEPPRERAAVGKPVAGQISVRAREDRGFIAVSIDDDGRGIDRARTARRAVALGLLVPDAAATLTDEQACEILFHPGFTTADGEGDLSGRGVGMDAIRVLARELGGDATVTPLAQGMRLEISFPSPKSRIVAFER